MPDRVDRQTDKRINKEQGERRGERGSHTSSPPRGGGGGFKGRLKAFGYESIHSSICRSYPPARSPHPSLVSTRKLAGVLGLGFRVWGFVLFACGYDIDGV